MISAQKKGINRIFDMAVVTHCSHGTAKINISFYIAVIIDTKKKINRMAT